MRLLPVTHAEQDFKAAHGLEALGSRATPPPQGDPEGEVGNGSGKGGTGRQ